MRHLVTLPFLLAMMALALPMRAQEQQRPDPGKPSFTETITVTAQKREQNVQDVPISITVIGGRKLADYELSDLVDVSPYVPNFSIEEGTEGAALTMRGIGNNGGTNFGFDSPVGMFVDGVYLGRLNQSRLPLLGVERIEVLRGPQSTLFGMNTVAGAISIVSREPSQRFEGDAGFLADPRYGRKGATVAVSAPLIDTVSLRVAALKTSHDGYFHNTFTGRNADGNNDEAVRLTLRWEPKNRWSVTAKLEQLIRFQNGLSRQLLKPPSDPAVVQRILVVDPRATFAPDLDTSLSGEFRDMHAGTALLKVSYAFDRFRLTSISAHSRFHSFIDNDVDSTAIDVSTRRDHENQRQFSEELRATSLTDGALEWIGGLYYQRDELTNDRLLDFALGRFLTSFAGQPAGQMQTYAGNFAQTFTNLSAFGELTWKAAPRLLLTGGTRYVSERKRANSYFDWLVPGTDDPRNALDPSSPEFAVANFVFHDVFGIVRHQAAGIYRHDTWLPDLKIQWYATPSRMLYISGSRGQKSGGFNDRDNKATNFSFRPETSMNYETGARATFAGGAAQFGVTLFRMDFRDMQVSVFDARNLVFIVANAAKALSQGVELEGRWRVSRALEITSSVGKLVTARFVEFLQPCVVDPADPSCVPRTSGAARDVGGQPVNAPNLSGGLGATAHHGLASTIDLATGLDMNYRGASQDTVNRRSRIGAAIFVNGRVGVSSPRGWRITLVGYNLTDVRFVEARIPGLFAGTEQGEIRPPRTITIETGYHF